MAFRARDRESVPGGDYRMVVGFDRKRSIAEYDKIDVLTVSLF
jgi:hypothetical protein